MNKVLRVNTRSKNVTVEDLKQDYMFFGGRGLVAKVMSSEVDPQCDPLGAANKLIVATPLFAGTPLTTANRLSVGGKSPLTGGIKEANVGGNAGFMLSRHGIKMIVLEDLPNDDKWSILLIGKDGNPKLVGADGYAGLNNYALVEKLHKKYGEDIAVLSIGVAGERKYANASMQGTDTTTGHPSRSAGRGGLGAVMGSKKIKAIVVEKPAVKSEIAYANKENATAACKRVVAAINDNIELRALTMLGTIVGIEATGPLGAVPVENYSGKRLSQEEFQKVNGAAFVEGLLRGGGKNGVACQPGCVVRCSNVWNDGQGGYVTSGFEYETIALNGPNCKIHDMNHLALIDKLCDDLGVDTIETGSTIAICMEAGKIPWGDKQAALGLIKEMFDGTEFGNLMGQGALKTGQALGVKHIPVAKGQAMPAFDPRNVKGHGVTFASSAMGADHTAGITLGQPLDHTKKEGQVKASMEAQMGMALADNTMCMMAFGGAMSSPDILPDLMAGVYGGEWDLLKLMGIAYQTLKMEREFNLAAGFTDEDERLPEYFYTEASPATGAVFDITHEEIAAGLQSIGL